MMKQPPPITVLLVVLAGAVSASVPAAARVESHFSSQPGVELDDVLVAAWAEAERAAQRGDAATLDIAVFSFTTQPLAEELLRLAKDNPALRIRLLTDLSQLSQSQRHMSPFIEFAARADYSSACRSLPSRYRSDCRVRLRTLLEDELLTNIEVAYKYYDAYVYAPGGRVVLEHRLSRLMHHKFVVVNAEAPQQAGAILVTGSYNFSPTAARSNYENLMVFGGSNSRDLIADYAAEFEALWNDSARVLPGDAARAWRRALVADMYAALED